MLNTIPALLLALALQSPDADKPAEFTFLFWTDQEISPKEGDISKCVPTAKAMNAIPGTAWPDAIGGKVAVPDFVTSAGDSTGWPTNAAVKAWDKICREILKYPTRAVAGNHDSGGKVASETFYRWMRNDPFVKAHADDNGVKAWTPPDAGSGIIPGIQYSFRHKGVVFIMPSPTYDTSGKSPSGSSPVYPPDLEWLRKELAKYDPKTPKFVVNHFNGGSIMNRKEIDALYEKNNVLLHLCGHWEKVQHWKGGGAEWVMDGGHRADDGTFSVIRVGRDRIDLAHRMTSAGRWHEKTLTLKIPARW